MMNKKTPPTYKIPLDGDDLKVLEKRIGIAIQEKTIAGLEKQLGKGKNSKRFLLPMNWKTAALWIGIVSIPFLTLLTIIGGEKGIFNRYYVPYDCREVAGIYRGLASEMYTPYYLYSMGNFSDALPRFRQYLEVNPTDVQARLLLAVCLIEKRDFPAAETEMNRIVESGNIYFRDDAHWYLALLSMRNGNFERASGHLLHLESNAKYKTRAESLGKWIAYRFSR
jgi:tetratricopeptide (TPR) repeat protein